MAVDAFALILAMLGLGLVFARLRVLPDNSADVLNRIVLYICLPASVLTYVRGCTWMPRWAASSPRPGCSPP